MKSFTHMYWFPRFCLATMLTGCGFESSYEDLESEGVSTETNEGTERDRSNREPRAAAGEETRFDIPLAQLPEEVLQRAEYYLSAYRDTEAAPTWSREAALEGTARALYAPDMEEPAYYEFSVTQGGYFILSTGPHDAPLTNLSYKGRRVTDRLIEEAHGARVELSRLYKLGSLAYAGEDATGELTANLGMDDKIASKPWGEVKREVVEEKRMGPKVLPEEWKTLLPREAARDTSKPGLTVRSAYRSELLEEVDLFQWRDPQIDCMIGCAPVAWGIITAYMDYIAETDYTTQDAMPQRFRDMGAANLLHGTVSAKQSFQNNAYTNEAITGIRSRARATCALGMTFVLPNMMRRYAFWANDHGGQVAVVDSLSTGRSGIDIAKETIAQGYPAVLLISTTDTLPNHYVVAHKHTTLMGQDQFYVNYGWRGYDDDQYVSNNVHWAGAAVPAP